MRSVDIDILMSLVVDIWVVNLSYLEISNQSGVPARS